MARILIVEDEAILAMTLSRMVEKEGHEVVDTVAYGDKVSEAIEAHQPHIVLMDIVLKGTMDGVSATKIINERYQLPVIYITGNTDEGTYKDAMNTMPVGYLEKPVNIRELMSLITKTLTDTEHPPFPE